MKLDVLKQIFRKYRPIQIAFGGGEPTLHPYFEALINYAKEDANIKHVNYTTNGVSLPKNFYNFESMVSGVSVSIDSLRFPSLFDEGIPKPILKNVEIYQKSPIRLILNFVVSNANFKDLTRLVPFLFKYNLETVYLLGFKNPSFYFSKNNIEQSKILIDFLSEAKLYGINVGLDCCLESHFSGKKRCKAGIRFKAFDIEGKESMCSFSHIIQNDKCPYLG